MPLEKCFGATTLLPCLDLWRNIATKEKMLTVFSGAVALKAADSPASIADYRHKAKLADGISGFWCINGLS
jgi:hypothetical protein